jgi:hypothetical protein
MQEQREDLAGLGNVRILQGKMNMGMNTGFKRIPQ